MESRWDGNCMRTGLMDVFTLEESRGVYHLESFFFFLSFFLFFSF